MIPAGIVASTISHASRSYVVSIRRCRMEAKNPRTIPTQSRQNRRSSARAVATCSPTMNARYGDSGLASCSTSGFQLPPSQAGTRTEWPRLEIGNSSVTPWTAPMTIAWR